MSWPPARPQCRVSLGGVATGGGTGAGGLPAPAARGLRRAMATSRTEAECASAAAMGPGGAGGSGVGGGDGSGDGSGDGGIGSIGGSGAAAARDGLSTSSACNGGASTTLTQNSRSTSAVVIWSRCLLIGLSHGVNCHQQGRKQVGDLFCRKYRPFPDGWAKESKSASGQLDRASISPGGFSRA